MKLYTKHGDQGETGLLYGGRVSKAGPRTEAYGAVDEAVSALGLARSLCSDARVAAIIERVQRELFTVGAELATDPAEYASLTKHFSVVSPDMTGALEADIDALAEAVELPQAFIIPGASAGSAALDVARATLRRAERRAVALSDSDALPNGEVLRYLNRTSDLLFILARYEESKSNAS